MLKNKAFFRIQTGIFCLSACSDLHCADELIMIAIRFQSIAHALLLDRAQRVGIEGDVQGIASGGGILYSRTGPGIIPHTAAAQHLTAALFLVIELGLGSIHTAHAKEGLYHLAHFVHRIELPVPRCNRQKWSPWHTPPSAPR